MAQQSWRPYPKPRLWHGYGVIFQITTNGTLSNPVVFDSTKGPIRPPCVAMTAILWHNEWRSISQLPWASHNLPLNPDGTFTNLYKFSAR